jgi:hypothetical protein
MHLISFLEYLQKIEVSIFGDQKLSKSELIAIARQSVAKGKTNDQPWISRRIKETGDVNRSLKIKNKEFTNPVRRHE